MPRDEGYTIADQLLRGGDRLLGSQKSPAVISRTCWPSTPPAALRSSTAESGAALILLAEPSVVAGHWSGHADPDLGLRRPAQNAQPK